MEKLFEQLSGAAASAPGARQERLLSAKEFLLHTSDEVDRASRYDRPLAVCMIVMDGLSAMRQTEGRSCHDGVMEHLLTHMVQLLRGPDRTALLGPGEIGVIMPETTLKNAAAVAERIRRSVADEGQMMQGDHAAPTASIGVAALSPRMREPQHFLMTGCFELRRAQSRGGNQVSVASPDTVRLSIPRSGHIH